jgi:hypothetical protein
MQQILGQYLDQGKQVIDPAYNANFKAATGHELSLGKNGRISVQGAAGNLSFAAGTDPAVVLSETKRYFSNLDRIIARHGG